MDEKPDYTPEEQAKLSNAIQDHAIALADELVALLNTHPLMAGKNDYHQMLAMSGALSIVAGRCQAFAHSRLRAVDYKPADAMSCVVQFMSMGYQADIEEECQPLPTRDRFPSSPN